ncbi:hypothetical protein AKJ39_00440 [candidate division MSBL1 archaeon SCGC-AAA259J03]|nr:hypothetical protein AKJ39_00440 [candidate division MSBL1 archaeon SCGC-AAA259J03]
MFDLIFSILLAILYLVFRFKLVQASIGETNILFTASFLFLWIGTIFYYLTSDMNPKLASSLHVAFFPLSSAILMFSKTIPDILDKGAYNETSLYSGIVVYVILLVLYFIAQMITYSRETPPEEELRPTSLE